MRTQADVTDVGSSPRQAKTLDLKLERIRSSLYRPEDFIIADARDADMSFGLTAPGPERDSTGRTGRWRSRSDYLDSMRAMVHQEHVDIMLTSASSMQTLAAEHLFDESPVTPAVRLNDATDIWNPRGSRYSGQAPRPFAGPSLERVHELCDVGLYSITFSNDRDLDLEALAAYAAFRQEAAHYGLSHFLEVFNPATDVGVADLGAFVNDSIVRTLAGITSPDRPLFLKTAYNGPAALEELASYDPSGVIVGILGGSKGTTRDTFELVAQVERYGARIALFGRKINLSEDPTTLVALMRQVVEGAVGPTEAVEAYHASLRENGIAADQSLEDDLALTDPVLKRAS